jgi:hypothetical protein
MCWLKAGPPRESSGISAHVHGARPSGDCTPPPHASARGPPGAATAPVSRGRDSIRWCGRAPRGAALAHSSPAASTARLQRLQLGYSVYSSPTVATARLQWLQLAYSGYSWSRLQLSYKKVAACSWAGLCLWAGHYLLPGMSWGGAGRGGAGRGGAGRGGAGRGVGGGWDLLAGLELEAHVRGDHDARDRDAVQRLACRTRTPLACRV